VNLQTKLCELIRIVSRDVADFITEEDCITACLETIAMVSSRERIEAVCLHESGHFAESVKLGVMVGFKESDIGYHAPRVIHCPLSLRPNKFEPNPGSIFTSFKAQEITWTLPILQQVARVAVAGGVYAHVIASRPIGEGTGGDWDQYETYYRIAHKTLHAHPERLDATELWEWATNEVQSDLEKHPELKDLARKRASQFSQDYYHPFLDFCDLGH